MAAVLKKRALAEYSQTITDDTSQQPALKKLRLTRKSKRDEQVEKTRQTFNDELSHVMKSSHDSVENLADMLPQLAESIKRGEIERNTVYQFYKKIAMMSDVKDSLVKTSYLKAIKDMITKYEVVRELLDMNVVVDDLLAIASRDTSYIVIASAIDTLHKIDMMEMNSEHRQKVSKCAKQLLQSNSNHLVINECLLLLADFAPVQDANLEKSDVSSIQDQQECHIVIKLLRDFSHYHESRVRSVALSCMLRLHEKGLKLDFSLYSEFCEALSDDYEGARMTAVKLLEVISHTYGDCLVFVSQGDEQIRLADDAFAKICFMMSDPSMHVRVQAATLLGKFTHVSPYFLEQTLEKKLMSNLRKKKSAHERHRETYEAGEWSSGRKWADDAPQEEVCPESVNLMNIGACGAFIHGLEDEFYEVRMATLDSVSQLAQLFADFANQALDFLVDMFNDEIEEIRLKAIQCLSQIGLENIKLRVDQVEIMLAVLEDYSVDIREALHSMLGNCKVATKKALKICIANLLDNLKKYPQDRVSIWNCFQKLGASHPHLTLPIVSYLLGIHSFLDLPEPSIEDNGYVGILIFVFNAAVTCPQMHSYFEKHILRHYFYLHDTYPLFVPHLPLSTESDVIPIIQSFSQGTSSSHTFLLNTFERVRTVFCIESATGAHTAILEHSIRDLQKLGEVEPSLSAASKFLCSYLQCQMYLRRILANTNWINSFLLSPLQSSSFRSSLQQLLNTTFILTNRFNGLHPIQLVCIQQTRLKAMALQLIAVIHGSNVSALSLCDSFLTELDYLEKLLAENNLQADSITSTIIKEINQLEEPKPGTVARVLQPLFLSSSVSQITDLTMMLSDNTFSSLISLRMSNATINEPTGKSETPLKFTAGLVLGVHFDAIIENITDIRNVRLRIQFPDQQTHVVLPKLSDFKLISSDEKSAVKSYRLNTTVYFSHGIWTEACHVEIGIMLDFRDTTSTTLNTTQHTLSTGLKASNIKSTKSEENLIIDLCKPVQVFVSPKQPKRAVL